MNVIQSRNNEKRLFNTYITYITFARMHPCIRQFLQLQVATFTPLHLYPIYFRSQEGGGGWSERMARTCTRLQIPCNKVCKKVNVNVFQNGSRVPTDATPFGIFSNCISQMHSNSFTCTGYSACPIQFSSFRSFDSLSFIPSKSNYLSVEHTCASSFAFETIVPVFFFFFFE